MTRVRLSPASREDVAEAALERLRHHDEAPAAAVGVVVDLHLLIFREIAYLHAVYLHRALLLRAADYALAQDARHAVREEGHDVYAVGLFHLHPLYKPRGYYPRVRVGGEYELRHGGG